MAILADSEIEDAVLSGNMISPFISQKTRVGVLSHGLGSYGYDARLGDEFGQILGHPQQSISPNLPPKLNTFHDPTLVTILSGKFMLAHTLEVFNIPDDVVATVKDKSTYARLGLAVQNTVLEAGWEGQVTLELSNHGPLPIQLLVGCGIVQVQFHRGAPCRRTYVGGFQGERGVVVSTIVPKEKE